MRKCKEPLNLLKISGFKKVNKNRHLTQRITPCDSFEKV